MKTVMPVIRAKRPDDVEGIEGVPPEYFLTRSFIGAALVAEVSYNPAFFLIS